MNADIIERSGIGTSYICAQIITKVVDCYGLFSTIWMHVRTMPCDEFVSLSPFTTVVIVRIAQI